MGVTQLSMQADVSPNGVITEVRVRNQFTTAKTEFQHLSSERKADSTEEEGEDQEEDRNGQEDQEDEKEEGEHQEDLASNGMVIKEESAEEKPLDAAGECETYQEEGSNGLEPPSTEPVKTEVESVAGDIASTEYNHSNGTEHHNNQQTNSFPPNSSDPEVVSKNIPGEEENDLAACVKKPKLESQDYCDNNGEFDPLGKANIFLIKMLLTNSFIV